MLVNIEAMLKGLVAKPEESWAKDFAKSMLQEVSKRYPENGTKVDTYCYANILHPYFRGSLLKLQSLSVFHAKVHQFKKENQVEVPVPPVAELEPEVDLDEDDFFSAAERYTQAVDDRPAPASGTILEGSLTPLHIELQNYFALPRLSTSKIDVLAWWKANQVTNLLLILQLSLLLPINQFYKF